MKRIEFTKMQAGERKAFDKLRKQQGKAIITDYYYTDDKVNSIEVVINIKDSNVVYCTDFIPCHNSIEDQESINKLITDVQEQNGRFDDKDMIVYKFESNIKKVRFLKGIMQNGFYGKFEKGLYNDFLREQLEDLYHDTIKLS